MGFKIIGLDKNKKSNMSLSDKLALGSSLFSSLEGLSRSFQDANTLRNQANTYALNSRLDNVDAQEAIRVGQQNAQIANIERYETKGKQLSSFAGSGFVATSGSYADLMAKTDSEYYKTMAALHYDAETAKNAKIFESDMNRIQSDYMRKIAGIRSKYGTMQSITQAIGSIALMKAGQNEKGKDK